MDHRHEDVLPAVVEQHARSTPGALAVVRGDHRLTYGELNQRANHVARTLLATGSRRGSVVGIYLGRSLEWVIAMLATLKAGAVCMSLDPNAPAERTVRAVGAARPVAILASGKGESPAPPETVPVPVLRVDAGEPLAGDTGDLDLVVRPDDLAYAVHTSGSAGKAKIVLAQHSWLTAGASVGATINRTTAADRGSWLGAPGAGIAIHEVCGLLWKGASIHVGEPEVITSPQVLREWLLANGITQTFVITPVGEVLQSLDWPPDGPLRLMTLGGDKLNRWAPAGLPFEIAVAYGSLEAFQIANTLYPWQSRCTPATATDADRAAPPPVGRPLPGVQVHVLEDDLRSTPEGTIGELWIDSPGLSLGYLGDPVLTADRFRPNPFGAPGSRLYRSGDAGRFRDDGVLEHHGRIDDVVKVRGHRVELGEVEWVLGGHPDVRQACVVAVNEADGNQLVACVVADGGEITPTELRGYAAKRLQDFMVPVAYVLMDRLPTNTSDKVDRLSLPPADWRKWRPAQPYREPSSEAEIHLAGLFSELLAVERVGADDNFIELGGDSLLVARLQQRIDEVFGVKVDLKDVMLAGSLSTLAQRVEGQNGDREELPRIVPRKRS